MSDLGLLETARPLPEPRTIEPGDRFDAAPNYALTRPARVDPHIAACVAEESMRLIDSARERCRPGELTLVPLP